MTRVPRFEGYVPSPAQRSQCGRLRAATAYARSIYADPAAKAIHVAAARKLGRQPFRLAISDYLAGDDSAAAARRDLVMSSDVGEPTAARPCQETRVSPEASRGARNLAARAPPALRAIRALRIHA